MDLYASHSRARTGPTGEPVLLLDQDRSRWGWMLVRRGLAAVELAQRTGGAVRPYALQAAIAACHARARVADDTAWQRIVALYGALAQLMPSPVVELNRAVGIPFGREATLELVERPQLRARSARLPPAADRARKTCSPGSVETTRRGARASARPH